MIIADWMVSVTSTAHMPPEAVNTSTTPTVMQSAASWLMPNRDWKICARAMEMDAITPRSRPRLNSSATNRWAGPK